MCKIQEGKEIAVLEYEEADLRPLPEHILDHMAVPDAAKEYGSERLYILGIFDKRITLFTQQTRAINLIYSLGKQGKLRAGDRVAILGAGAGGLPAAIAATTRQAVVTVFEKEAAPLN